MEFKLSTMQRKLAAMGKAKGFLTFGDFNRFYSCVKSRKEAMNRLCDIGLFKMTESGKLVYCEEMDNTLVRYLVETAD